MTRTRLLPLAVLLLVAAMAAGVWAWRLRPVAVQVVETARDVPIQVFGLGTVEAQILSRVGFETAGTLVELRADHGDSVKADTVLARLDSREQEARVTQARAAVKQAEAAIEQAMANVERADALLKEKTLTNVRQQELVGRGPVSQQTADEAQAAADVAKADLTQARSAVTVTRANLEQAKAALAFEAARLAKFSLYAPFDALAVEQQAAVIAVTHDEKIFDRFDRIFRLRDGRVEDDGDAART